MFAHSQTIASLRGAKRRGNLPVLCTVQRSAEEVTRLLQGEDGIKEWVEAKFVVDTDIESLGDKMIACIEAKRDALGI